MKAKTEKGHKKPEERALVTESDLAKMQADIRDHLMETEIVPLQEKLNAAITAVQPTALDLKRTTFLAPTKEQVMNMIAPGCKNERMLSLFIETCHHLQLDPIKREIYLYNQSGDDWVIKVDYKVPIAIAQRDTDYLHFKSWVEYWSDEKKKNNLNPDGIRGAYCRIFKRSWVKLAHQTENPELAYKEHFVPWDTWRRTTKAGVLFGTWRDRGHFYIEKTAIDHCFRLVYSELLGGLPPSAGYEIVEEEGRTVEAKIINDHNKLEYEKKNPKTGIDRDFSKASEPKEDQGPKLAAMPQQITAIEKLMSDEKLPEETGNKIAKRLTEHQDALKGKGKNYISSTEASDLITGMQRAIDKQEEMNLE